MGAILRPSWKGITTTDVAVPVAGSGGTVDLLNLSDGPGIIRSGGFSVQNLSDTDDYDLKLVVDGVTLFDLTVKILATLSISFPTRPWDLVQATTTFDMSFIENANLAYVSTIVLELENNGVPSDNLNIQVGLDYHVGV